MSRSRRLTAIGLVLATLSGGAVAAETGWTIAKPQPDNPLQTASLAGTARAGEHSSPAQLVIGCRPDADMTAQLTIPETLGFDTDPFEGPDGIGERQKRLTIAFAGDRSAPRLVSGWWSENTVFTFSFALSKPEAARWLARPGQTLAAEIRPPDAGKPALALTFRLPEDAARLKQVVGPCGVR
ncbi:hypothetical protein QFZ27_003359 [Inquilinus ginsengisoli]|uniref:hypothetical protein n=1 Tax=Inquilinus ginsengisoli TaxID=363840 RepID=UPI003D1B02CF